MGACSHVLYMKVATFRHGSRGGHMGWALKGGSSLWQGPMGGPGGAWSYLAGDHGILCPRTVAGWVSRQT